MPFSGTRIELVLAGAVASVNPFFSGAYVDVDNTAGTLVPGSTFGQTNGNTSVVVYTDPGGSVARVLKTLSVYNADSAAVTLTVQYNASTVITKFLTVTLQPGERLRYDEKRGFFVSTALLAPKIGAVSSIPGMPNFLAPIVDAAGLATSLLTASGSMHTVWLGVSPKVSSSIAVLFDISVAAITVQNAEIAIFRGQPFAQGANLSRQTQPLTLLGTVDVASVVTGLGIHKVTVPLTIPAQPGDELWVCFHIKATTQPQLRAGLVDNSGAITTATSLTGSLSFTTGSLTSFLLFAPTNFIMDTSSAAVPWVAGYVN